ncbi:MAG TPA: hypothetical protein VGJ04_03490 [Pirellulales bacterium]|jgi:hypothetical protein
MQTNLDLMKMIGWQALDLAPADGVEDGTAANDRFWSCCFLGINVVSGVTGDSEKRANLRRPAPGRFPSVVCLGSVLTIMPRALG